MTVFRDTTFSPTAPTIADDTYYREQAWSGRQSFLEMAQAEQDRVNWEAGLANPWISVADRLPSSMEEYVLLAIDGFDGDEVGQGWYNLEHGRWYKIGSVMPQNVTHWMPFPNPPQVQQ